MPSPHERIDSRQSDQVDSDYFVLDSKKVSMTDREMGVSVHPGPPPGRTTRFENAIHLTTRQISEPGQILREWEGGPLSHLTRLTIPQASDRHGFNFSATGHLFSGLLSAKVYCDSLTGISGDDTDQAPIVAHLVTSGRLVYRSGGVSHVATPGRILIRDARTSWEFSCAPATRVRAVTIPRHLVLSRITTPRSLDGAYISDAAVAEVRLLVNFLEAIEKSSGDLDHSATAQEMARDACATLISGMLSNRSASGIEDHPNATLKAAKRVIERNLDRPDICPAVIAQLVGVSPRTLHRSFSESNDSVMAFIRRRRLQRARDELMKQGATARVSDIAARWQFADASHFIRNFKSSYGTTPAAYLKSHDKVGGET